MATKTNNKANNVSTKTNNKANNVSTKTNNKANNVSIVKKIRNENNTLAAAILAVYRLHSEMQDKDAREICNALNITAATTKNRAARNELRLQILKRLPVIAISEDSTGKKTTVPAALKKPSKDSNVFLAAVSDWTAAIVAAVGNKADESGNYKQICVEFNVIEWIKDNNTETNNVNRDATKIFCYDKSGNDITESNAAFVNTYIHELEAKRVANKAAKVTKDQVYTEQIKILNGGK